MTEVEEQEGQGRAPGKAAASGVARVNSARAKLRGRPSTPSGPLPAALREWCGWIWRQADLAYRTRPDRRTPEGEPSTIFDFMGQVYERPLLEEAIRSGVFDPGPAE